MDRKLSSLYRLGGLTGIVSGFLMFASSIWFIFGLSHITSQPLATQLAFIGRTAAFHGIGVVTLILLIPTVLASYGLLVSEANARSTLGAAFAMVWIIIELIAHCSQTAPLVELAGGSITTSFSGPFYSLWAEWGEALFMTGAFLCVLSALCYGSALGSWGNSIASSLFFLTVLAFPVGVLLIDRVFVVDFGIQLHVLVRGVAFLFLGGVLIQAPANEVDV